MGSQSKALVQTGVCPFCTAAGQARLIVSNKFLIYVKLTVQVG